MHGMGKEHSCSQKIFGIGFSLGAMPLGLATEQVEAECFNIIGAHGRP